MVAKATVAAYIASMVKHYRASDFTGEGCIGYLMSRAYSSNKLQLEALFEGADLNFTQWRVLMCLRDGLANTSADISRELSHDKGSMTRLIDQLDARGLLRRQRNVDDRRVVFLTLTPAGRAAVSRLIPKIVDYYNALLGGFSSQEVKVLTQLLRKLRSALKQSGESPPSHEEARAS